MITISVKRFNRDHDIVSILQFDHDTTITSKHYKIGVQAAFKNAAESYENDFLLIKIYDDDLRHILNLIMETYTSGSDIWVVLYPYGSREILRRMYIAC